MFFSAICVFANYQLSIIADLWIVSVLIFAIAWVFQFYGHHLEGKKPSFLKDLDTTIVLFESPHRLIKTLNQLKEALGERPVVVGRELTKLYEEIIRGNFSSTIDFFDSKKIKGEIVIMIGKNDDRIHF